MDKDKTGRGAGYTDRALHILSIRDHSRRELEIKLQRMGCSETEAAEVIAKCTAWGYLDDGRFARRFAEEKLRCGWGWQRIYGELLRRGISEEIAGEIRQETDNEKGKQLQYENARWLARKKAAQGRSFASVCRFLSSRGFDSETVLAAVKEALAERGAADSDFQRKKDFDYN